ncbi:MAG: hybrid sensor histidine kinase/response regulator [Cyanobacteria bacterium J06641_5]
MDTEQQLRLNFLDEAQAYFDRIEATFLNSAAIADDPQQLDAALRAAHSIKGGAAMMGFQPLSQTAHRLEDFLKILRVRPEPVDMELETAFLRGVDALRGASARLREADPDTERWLAATTTPVFDGLQQRLGDLRPEDDDAILAQEEDIDVASLMFESGVGECLERLESQLDGLDPAQLREELHATAAELAEFGRMKALDNFVALCASVEQQTQTAPADRLGALAREAIGTWQRSQSLVALGRESKLPTQLETSFSAAAAERVAAPSLDSLDEFDLPNLDDLDVSDLVELQAEVGALQTSDLQAAAIVAEDSFGPLDSPETAIAAPEEEADLGFDVLAPEELTELQESVSALDILEQAIEAEGDCDIGSELEAPDLFEDAVDLSLGTLAPEELAELQESISALEVLEPAPELERDFADTAVEPSKTIADTIEEEDFDLEAAIAEIDLSPVELAPEPAPPTLTALSPTPAIESPRSQPESAAMVRVSAEQLRRVSSLFGQLILERNAINLRLDQLRGFVDLMQGRVRRLEDSNTQLRKWYDRASVDGLLGAGGPTSGASQPQRSESSLFDALEMDRYSELHPIAQEQMETIVQLQEVAADINFGLQEMGQATSDLDRTTRELQRGITRTQMRPFSDAVGRFPRVVRDLGVQYGKQVNLQLQGETVLLDRLALEALTDPLNHLLRNAFDHGLEDPATRQAAGKPAQGTISIAASNRGNQTIVTIRDDGRGIPLEKIRARIEQMGLSAAEVARLSDRELLDFIFEPGFSTAARVTELSGRGVGMDVVRTNLRQLRGNIQVATQPGQGTTFTITIPQSLSILRVMLLEAAGMVFAVSADAVKEVSALVDTEAETIAWNDTTIPILRLSRWLQFRRPRQPFEMEGAPKIARPTAAVIGGADAWHGLHIERFWGEQEVTIRPIASPVALTPGVVGSTILGDGRAIPLIDPTRLLEWIAEQKQTLGDTQQHVQVPAVAQEARQDTILVADDSVNVRRYLSLALERAGYQIEQAKDGQEAVDKIFSNPAISAVVCDVEMPRMDGYDVLAEVRGKDAFKDLPIAMLTSRSSDKHRKIAMNLGASAYFSKPYNEQEMLQTLADLIAATKPLADPIATTR